MNAIVQALGLLSTGLKAADIIEAIADNKPDLSGKIDKLIQTGQSAESILRALVDKENKTTERMFRSEFGDYLANIKKQSAKDYKSLVNTIATAGIATVAGSKLFKKYGQPAIEILGPEQTSEKPIAPETAAESFRAPPQVEMRPPSQVAPSAAVEQPLVPKTRQISTPIPTEAPIPLPSSEGLTPRQENIVRREQELRQQQAQPQAQVQPIILEQRPAPIAPRPQAAMPEPVPRVEPIKGPMLLETEQYKKNPVFGNAILKAVKQGFSKKQVKELIEKAFRKQAGEFEQETGRNIEDELDILYSGKNKVLQSILTPAEEKPLVEAGLKPKLKLSKAKPNVSMLDVLTQAPEQKQTGVSPNVDKQAFLMQLQELKKLLR